MTKKYEIFWPGILAMLLCYNFRATNFGLLARFSYVIWKCPTTSFYSAGQSRLPFDAFSSQPSLSPKRNFVSKNPKMYPFISITSVSDAHSLITYLNAAEREMLYQALSERVKITEMATSPSAAAAQGAVVQITKEQRKALFLANLLPFVGFGILDNLLMIVAGEYIDNTLGIMFGISTMAAAGLGNILSDIAGVGSAHYVEYMVAKVFGIKTPSLSAEQWTSPGARWTSNMGRCFGLVFGCLIGMFPLIFFDEKEKQEKKLAQNKPHDV